MYMPWGKIETIVLPSPIWFIAMLFNEEYIPLSEKFHKLIVSLKTATVNEYTLDKEATSYDDLFDAVRLSLKCYEIN